MSHNKISIGTATPDATGALSVGINDLSDISGTPSDGDVLGYASGAWAPTSPPGIQRIAFAGWRLSSGTFNTSTANFDVGDNTIWRNAQMFLYDQTYTQTTASSGPYVPAASSAWTMHWTLKASTLEGKTVRAEAVHMAKQLTTGERIVYQWMVGTSVGLPLASSTPIGPRAEQTVDYVTPCFGTFTVGSSDVYLGLKVVEKTGTMGLLTGNVALSSYVALETIG